LLGRPADDEETLIRTLTLNGPVVAFHIHGRKSLRVLGWDAVDATRLATLMRIIKEQTVTLMRSMIALRDKQASDTPKVASVKAINSKRVQR